ncbi:MAG: deoxyribose-phosphate aldolase [Clostridiales bacterium]|nr:deoxyribose-phosphate aldolase [Clostridiales bacterium]
MEIRDILNLTDHTLLKNESRETDIALAVDDGIKYRTALVCIPPSYAEFAVRHSAGRVKIGTVAGFSHGYIPTAVKLFEAETAMSAGCDELDMVANIGWIKDAKWDSLLAEIRGMKRVCGDRVLKVIIECCLLTDEEKTAMCRIVSEAGADFIKTSTGFCGGGATCEDVRLMKANVIGRTLVKAAGGIRTFEDAAALIESGASRLGTSALVKVLKNEKASGY